MKKTIILFDSMLEWSKKSWEMEKSKGDDQNM
jgi:hypothetical protein